MKTSTYSPGLEGIIAGQTAISTVGTEHVGLTYLTVGYKIKEGNKERIQSFRGVVIQISGSGTTKTFTVRKMSGNIGVERIFPLSSPFIDSIEINKRGKVRRKRIFYLRDLTGKKARIKERKY
jgi:large subunit ribosomal protein L19